MKLKQTGGAELCGAVRSNHGNAEAVGFSARNPNATQDHVSLYFTNNIARIRVDGGGATGERFF